LWGERDRDGQDEEAEEQLRAEGVYGKPSLFMRPGKTSIEGYDMNESDDIPRHLSTLRQKLDSVDGVHAKFAAASEVAVEFRGRKIGNWIQDGKNLTGAFVCEAVLLCADSVDEAYRLTVGRLA
jgi:hypothetical protein